MLHANCFMWIYHQFVNKLSTITPQKMFHDFCFTDKKIPDEKSGICSKMLSLINRAKHRRFH